MRNPGFNNADGLQDTSNALNIDGFDNCGGCGMHANGQEDNFVDEYAFNANGEHDPVDGEYNADGEQDEFVYNAEGDYIGAAGEYNANGEHFDADGDEFQFNADGEYAGVDGEYNSNGDYIDGFDNFRSEGFSNAGGDEDDNFLNARGKAARQEKKATRQAARQERKAVKVAAKTEIKKAKAAAKVEKKQAKTAAKVAKKEAKIERKNTKVNARVARKAADNAARNTPVDIATLMNAGETVEVEQMQEPIAEQEIMQENAPEENSQEIALEVETDPSQTNVEMTDEDGGPAVDMEEVENFLNANGGDDQDNDHFFISLPGAQRRKTRQAVKAAKKLGKVKVKTAKGLARADQKQAKADSKRVKASTKETVRTTRAQGTADAKLERAPNRYKSVEAISKAASNVGIAAAASLGAASLGKSAAKAIAAKKANGEELTEEEKMQLASAKTATANTGASPNGEDTDGDGIDDETGLPIESSSLPKKSTKQAGMGGTLMWITVGLVVVGTVGYFLTQKGSKKAA